MARVTGEAAAVRAVVDSFCQRMPVTARPGNMSANSFRGDQKRRANVLLDMLPLEGLDSGEPLPVTPAFWEELKCEALAKLGKRTTR